MKEQMSVRQVCSVFKREYTRWLTNPKMIVCLIMLVMIRETVVLPLSRVAEGVSQPMNVLEPIIAVANSNLLMLVLPLVYIVITADFPALDGNTYFYLVRTGRMNWVVGQILFQLVSLTTYLLFVIFSTGIQVGAKSFIANGWSLPFAAQNDNYLSRIVDGLIPLNLHYQMSPYLAFSLSYIFVFLFLVLCSGIMLLAAMYGRKIIAFWGILLSIAIGILLCVIRSKWMWLFPVSHSIVSIHFKDYYREYTFSPWLSVLLFVVVIAALYTAILRKGKNVNLDILREEREG